MSNEYTVHFEVRDAQGDKLYAGRSAVQAESCWDAGQKFKALVTLDQGESLYIWEVREE